MSSQAEDKGVNPWKMILGGAPLILLVLIVSVYALFAYAFPQGKQQYAARYAMMLKQLGTAALPADSLALLREVDRLASRPEASLPAVVVMVGVASDALRDRRVSDGELKNLVLVCDFAKSQNCAVGFDELGRFLAAHPEIKSILDHHDLPVMAPAAPSTATTATQISAG